MVDEPSETIDPGSPLNTISKYNDTNKYFTERKSENELETKFNEDDVVEFIAESIH